jgi:hypothetical protein
MLEISDSQLRLNLTFGMGIFAHFECGSVGDHRPVGNFWISVATRDLLRPEFSTDATEDILINNFTVFNSQETYLSNEFLTSPD